MVKKVLSTTLLISALSLSSTFADEIFKNSIDKIDVYQAVEGVVRVNIYTNSPYGDALVVNKKPDNKYVILLPEMGSSMISKPSLNSVSNLIQDVDIKTQPYSTLPGKGYTKITFSAKKPIEIVPQSYTATKKTSVIPTPVRPSNSIVAEKPVVQPTPVAEKEPVKVPVVEKKQANPIVVPKIIIPEKPKTTTTVVKQLFTQKEEPKIETISENEISGKIIGVENILPQTDIAVENDEQSRTPDEATYDEIMNSTKPKMLPEKQSFMLKIKNEIVKKLPQFSFSSIIIVLQLLLLAFLIKIIIKMGKKLNSNSSNRAVGLNNIKSRSSYSSNNIDSPAPVNGFKKTPLTLAGDFRSNVNNLYDNNSLSQSHREMSMSVFDENINNIEKSIFKNPLKEISKMEESKLFDGEEEESFYTPVATTVQTHSYIENNSLPTETFIDDNEPFRPSEEFFIFEENNDSEIDSEYQISEEPEDEYEYEYEEEYDEDEYEYIEEDELEDEVDNKQPIQSQTTTINHQSKNVPAVQVKSTYRIDANRSLLLISTQGINVLIGKVGEQVFIVKKFKNEIINPIQVRLSETKPDGVAVYIVKVDEFKILVEVKDSSIKYLLDI